MRYIIFAHYKAYKILRWRGNYGYLLPQLKSENTGVSMLLRLSTKPLSEHCCELWWLVQLLHSEERRFSFWALFYSAPAVLLSSKCRIDTAWRGVVAMLCHLVHRIVKCLKFLISIYKYFVKCCTALLPKSDCDLSSDTKARDSLSFLVDLTALVSFHFQCNLVKKETQVFNRITECGCHE